MDLDLQATLETAVRSVIPLAMAGDQTVANHARNLGAGTIDGAFQRKNAIVRHDMSASKPIKSPASAAMELRPHPPSTGTKAPKAAMSSADDKSFGAEAPIHRLHVEGGP